MAKRHSIVKLKLYLAQCFPKIYESEKPEKIVHIKINFQTKLYVLKEVWFAVIQFQFFFNLFTKYNIYCKQNRQGRD